MRYLLLLIAVLALSGCGTYYKEPSSKEPRALLSAQQKACFIDCKGGVFIQAVNGEELSINWKTNNYYVHPGPADIVVAVSDIGLFGVCVLKLDAVDGEKYDISHAIDGDVFVITAYDSAGTAQASCKAKMGPPPAGTNYMPIIIPVSGK